MAKGISIHIGLNELDSGHYIDKDLASLEGCVNDANVMCEIAKHNFTEPNPFSGKPNTVLSDNSATIENVTDHIKTAATNLDSGDTLLVTYSGHGGAVKDVNDDINDNEGDGFDETWCLFNRQILDDELFELWTIFKKGVRILIISDSCQSGTVTGPIGMDITNTDKINFNSLGINVNNLELKFLNDLGFDFATHDKEILEQDKQKLSKIDFDFTKLDKPYGCGTIYHRFLCGST